MNIALTEALLTVLGICLLFLLPMAVMGGLELEDYKDPGGWRLPKAEVMGFLSAVAAILIMAAFGWILANF
jgi:hypothetical protein